MSNHSKPIFLSHAVVDESLVEEFETLLTRWLGITSTEIFCSSLVGQGIPTGKDFRNYIHSEITNTEIVICILTPSYIESAFCMAELGAAWALSHHRYPVVVPPNTFDVMEATLLGINGVKIDDDIGITQMLEDIFNDLQKSRVQLKPPTAGVQLRAIRNFYKAWESLKERISEPDSIAATIHKKITEERDECKCELKQAEALIEKLYKLKDATAVKEISEQFTDSSWETKFEAITEKVDNICGEFNGSAVVRQIILSCLGRPTSLDWNNPDPDLTRAIEIGAVDLDSRQLNFDNEDIKAVQKAVLEMQDLIIENPKIAENLEAKGEKYNPEDIRFWEAHTSC